MHHFVYICEGQSRRVRNACAVSDSRDARPWQKTRPDPESIKWRVLLFVIHALWHAVQAFAPFSRACRSSLAANGCACATVTTEFPDSFMNELGTRLRIR